MTKDENKKKETKTTTGTNSDSSQDEHTGKKEVIKKPGVAVSTIELRKNDNKSEITRRTLFSWLGVAWIAFSGAVLGFLTMTLRFMFPNVLFEAAMTFKAGYPDEYIVGEVDDRWKNKFSVWLIRTSKGIYALSSICTHLGCTPNWLLNDNKFKCPCHGSGFYKTGVNFEGPAPRPLERFRIVLAEDGQILVDKTRIFQQEKGEWNDTESFLTL